MASIKKMKAAQRVNMIADAINGVKVVKPAPMKPKPVNALLSGRRRGPYNQE